MTEALTIAQDGSAAPRTERKLSVTERRCLATGAMRPRGEMIRFVIGPDADVVPDLAENLPGTGLWVTATCDAVAVAAAKNLFAKAAQTRARPAPNLADNTAQLLRRRCLNFLGLAKGAGIATLGEMQTEAALRANKITLYLHAPDAARALDNRHGVPICAVFSRGELGAAFGYDHIAYAGIAAHGLTEKLKRELTRLHAMTAPEKTGQTTQ